MSYEDIINKSWIMDRIDWNTGKKVAKTVKVTAIIDGPQSDPRDYCIIEGLEAWEMDVPLVNFINQARSA